MSDRSEDRDRTPDDQAAESWPPPAAHEVERAGAAMLPGMDEVAPKPEPGRGYPT